MEKKLEQILERPHNPDSPPGKGEVILVVDDKHQTLNLLRTILEDKGYNPILASSIEKAKELLTDYPVKTVLTDYFLRDLPLEYQEIPEEETGLELQRYCAEKFKGIPVLLMREHMTNDFILDMIKQGITGLVQKPIVAEDLQKNIERGIEKSKKNDKETRAHYTTLLSEYNYFIKNRKINLAKNGLDQYTKKLKDLRKQLGEETVWMHDVFFMDGMAILTDDAAYGVVGTEVNPDEKLKPEKDYYLIKRTHQLSDIRKQFFDLKKYNEKIEYTTPNGTRKTSTLHAKPHFTWKHGDYFYLVTEMFPAADNAKLFSLMDQDEHRNRYSEVKKTIVEVILETWMDWRKKTMPHITSSEENWNKYQLLIDEAMKNYQHNIKSAIGNIRRFTNSPINDTETDRFISTISYLLNIYKEKIPTNIPIVGRIRDDCVSNSGLLTYRIQPRIEDLEELLHREPDQVYEDEQGVLHVSKEFIRTQLRNWDTPDKIGTIGEDAKQVFEDFDLNLSEENKMEFHKYNMDLIFGLDDKQKKVFWPRHFIDGFYRALRKMDLAITKYSSNNEIEYEHRRKTHTERNRKRNDYKAKASHYCFHAVKSLLGYYTFITTNTLDNMSFEEGLQKVSRFNRDYKGQMDGLLNPEHLPEDNESYDPSSPKSIFDAANLVKEECCGQKIDFPSIKEYALGLIGKKKIYNILINLHLHTNGSDGQFPPEESLEKMIEAKDRALAKYMILSKTDHDTFDGTDYFIDIPIESGIITFPGIELSTKHIIEDNNGNEKGYIAHILAYFTTETYLAKKPWLLWEDMLNNSEAYRIRRMKKMVSSLQNEGYDLCWEELEELYKPGIPSRIHLAALLYKMGKSDSIFEARSEIVNKINIPIEDELFLAMPTIYQTVDKILDAGGIPVIPHVNELPEYKDLGRLDLVESLLDELIDRGLEGIEMKSVYSPTLWTICQEKIRSKNLIPTYGTDWHGRAIKPQAVEALEDRYGAAEILHQRGLIPFPLQD